MDKEFLRSADFRIQFIESGKTPSERLRGLSKLLSQCNKGMSLDKPHHKLVTDLSIQDVIFLKELICAEIERTNIKNPEIVADQILFLIIGAIRLQTQNRSDKPWDLVELSIKSFLLPEKKNNPTFLLASLATIMVTIGLGMAILPTPKQNDLPAFATLDKTQLTKASISEAGPATLSALVNIYNKMKDGNCQLPQAAMLPPEQRQAFLSFINDGELEVANVDNLKLALGRVHCLYPQKLMYQPL